MSVPRLLFRDLQTFALCLFVLKTHGQATAVVLLNLLSCFSSFYFVFFWSFSSFFFFFLLSSFFFCIPSG